MRQGCFGQATRRFPTDRAATYDDGNEAESLAAEDSLAQLLQLAVDVLDDLPVALGRGDDAERPEQVCRWSAGVARLPEHGVQTLARQVVEHEVHDAPRVVRLRRHYGIESRI